MSAQVAADLRAAADVLRRDGWTQGVYWSPEGCYCAIGAIRAAKGISENGPSSPAFPAWDALEDYLRDAGIAPNALEWNDAKGRTADEVIAALEAAAAAAEAQQ